MLICGLEGGDHGAIDGDSNNPSGLLLSHWLSRGDGGWHDCMTAVEAVDEEEVGGATVSDGEPVYVPFTPERGQAGVACIAPEWREPSVQLCCPPLAGPAILRAVA